MYLHKTYLVTTSSCKFDGIFCLGAFSISDTSPLIINRSNPDQSPFLPKTHHSYKTWTRRLFRDQYLLVLYNILLQCMKCTSEHEKTRMWKVYIRFILINCWTVTCQFQLNPDSSAGLWQFTSCSHEFNGILSFIWLNVPFTKANSTSYFFSPNSCSGRLIVTSWWFCHQYGTVVYNFIPEYVSYK